MLEPVLVKVNWKGKWSEEDYKEYAIGPEYEGTLKIRDNNGIVEIDSKEKIYKLCELEDPDEWQIVQYMNTKKYNNLILALKVSQLELSEKNYAVESVFEGENVPVKWIRHPAPKKTGEKKTNKNEKPAYFVYPYYGDSGDEGKRELSNPYTGAGVTKINIYSDESPKIPERSVALRTHPGAFTEEEYRQILRDLMRIHRELVSIQKGSTTVGDGDLWGQEAEEIKMQVSEMKQILLRIEESPEVNLTAVPTSMQFHKIKHMNPRTIIDYELGKSKVKTIEHQESVDIYEHRVIVTYLNNLKKLVNQYMEIDISERDEILEEDRELREKLNMANDERKGMFEMEKHINDAKEKIQEKKREWKEIIEDIEQLLDIFSALIGVSDEAWPPRSTNLFLKHPDYRRAYALMKKTLVQFEGIDLLDEIQRKPVGPTQQIYETWCLFKMLTIFIRDYGFELIGVYDCEGYQQKTDITDTDENQEAGKIWESAEERHELADVVKDYIIERKSPSGTLYKLRNRELDMEIRLDYEVKIHVSYKEGKKYDYWWPDYVINIRTGDKKTKRFVMDAKCKNYKNMKEGEWHNDLFGAMNKYLYGLNKDLLNENKSMMFHGAYILHADSEEMKSPYFGTETEAMCGTVYEDKYVKLDEEFKKEEKMNFERKGAGVDFRIGSICFSPLSTEIDGKTTSKQKSLEFRRLIQMIMEHHIGIYKEKCWICGSSDLRVEEGKTKGGNMKEYITCKEKDCGQFWIKTHCYKCNGKYDPETKDYTEPPIYKHYTNYYIEKDDEGKKNTDKLLVMVKCPVCGQC